MAAVKYKLIDGAFFEGLFREYGRLIDRDLFSKLHWPSVLGNASRCIYYDALPVKKDRQSQPEFEAAECEKLKFLNILRAQRNMQVRDGLTRLRTKGNGQHMSQVFEQKGVDTWIAVDAIRYALTGLCDEIEIYTSDSDLYPVFEALQGTRCRGKLWYQRGRTAQELIFSADWAEEITFSKALELTTLAGELQSKNGSHRVAERIIGAIEAEGKMFEIFARGEAEFGCNLFYGGVYNHSYWWPTIYQLADFVNANGGALTYVQARSLV